MGIGKDFGELMHAIGYNFIDVTFLETALTHSSYTNEMRQKGFRAESEMRAAAGVGSGKTT